MKSLTSKIMGSLRKSTTQKIGYGVFAASLILTPVVLGGCGSSGGNNDPPTITDTDSDGIKDADDNCKDTYNPAQTDTDSDGLGDLCDTDIDDDGILNADDNCQYVSNPAQLDTDSDGLGDLCDTDIDDDGILNADDNCQYVSNPAQLDTDSDGLGDLCDTDIDDDGILNADDNCQYVFNPGQDDSDGDGIGNACDPDDTTIPGIIAYESDRDGGDEEIYSTDGITETNISLLPGNDRNPICSPDGSKIAYMTDFFGNQNIAVMDVDGGNKKLLTVLPENDSPESWSPDATKIAYRHNGAIYIMDSEDGENKQRLTSGPITHYEFDPRWIDNQNLIISRTLIGDPTFNADLYKANLSGGLENLTNTPNYSENHPRISPDKTLVAFMSERDDGEYAIYTMNTHDGSNVTKLTQGGHYTEFFSWSPTSEYLVGISYQSLWTGDLERISIYGEPKTTLVEEVALDPYTIVLPDESVIFSDVDTNFDYQIHRLLPDMTTEQLTFDGYNYNPTFCPN